jgi:predicted nucleic acid-binding protein
MAKLLFDTSALIAHWHRCSRRKLASKTTQDACDWADRLAELHQTRTIVTPVAVEFLAGTRSGHELDLARAYLSRFEVIDGGRITLADWDLARRVAERVPHDGKPRQLGDCLIRALAQRFKCNVVSFDERFP